MHKTKSSQSTFVDAEEGELIEYWENGNMQIFGECYFVTLKHSVTILVTSFTNYNNLTNDLFILKSLDNKQILSLTDDVIRQRIKLAG